MISFLFFLFGFVSLVVAADPRLCDGDPDLTPTDFKLKYTANSYLPALSKLFDSVSVSNVLDTANRDLTKKSPSKGSGTPVESWTWNSGDDATTKWVPQGISGSADALAGGTWEGRSAWAVSWYQAEGDRNVRISFVDRATHKYRHVLLVDPSANDDFKEVAPVHAGGIVWYGDALYVVDTDHGLRVFDLTNIWEVEIADGVGKDPSSGKYSANTYQYVAPQMWTYNWTELQPSSKFRHSWVSLDRSSTPDSLLIGEFSDTDRVPIRLVKYPLDSATRGLATTDGVATATFAYCVGILKVQGGLSRNGKYYFGNSAGSAPGDLWTWSPGQTASANKGYLPPGPEDFSYNEAQAEWYTITEHTNDRFILAYKDIVN